MGDRLGIIAGSGEFPLLAAVEARKKGWECVVAAVRGEADPVLENAAGDVQWLQSGEPAELVGFLKNRGISEVLIAGRFNPETLFRTGPLADFVSAVAGRSRGKSPVRLIGTLIGFLEAQGIRVLDPTPFLESLFCPPGVLTAALPSSSVLEDVAYGFEIAKTLADLDIGQTVIIKDRTVIAVEGIEGTDRAIRRGAELAGSGIVAVKVSRSKQDPRIDIPGVGLRTVNSLIGAEGRSLCFEAEKIPFFQKEEAVALADSRGVSILAYENPGRPYKPGDEQS